MIRAGLDSASRMLLRGLAASAALSFLMGAAPIGPHPAPPLVHARTVRPQHGGITISRLDQTSRAVRISGLRPDLRTEVYANGFLVSSGVARSTAVSLPIRGGQDHIKGWALENAPSTMLVMTQESKRTFNGLGGTTPVVSSNGETLKTGIVLAIQRPANKSPAIRLYAYDAMKLSHQLISLPVGNYDRKKGSYFGVPTVVNGRVYVGFGSGIAVFGELQ